MHIFVGVFLAGLVVLSVNIAIFYVIIIQDLTKPDKSLESANTGAILAFWFNLFVGVTVFLVALVSWLNGYSAIVVALVFTLLTMVYPLRKLWLSRRLQAMETRPWMWAWMVFYSIGTVATLAVATISAFQI